MGLKILGKNDLKAIRDIKPVEVTLPELGEGVGVLMRGLTFLERDNLDARVGADEKDRSWWKGFRLEVVAHSICDADGNSIMNDKDGRATLNGLSSKTIIKLYDKACELSGMGEYSMENAKKKLLEDPTNSSGTNSSSQSEEGQKQS